MRNTQNESRIALPCHNHVVMKFFSKNLFLWWHELANSLRLLRLHSSFLQIIKNFSVRQRLHFLLILLYGLHFLSILHLTLNSLFSFLSVQMYLDSLVSFCFLWFRKDDVWFLYRSLKLPASPTYVSVVGLLVTVTWCTMLFVRHCPLRGFFDVFRGWGWRVIWEDCLIMWRDDGFHVKHTGVAEF